MATSVLDPILDPITACLTPESARVLAEQRADEKTQVLFDLLAVKANEGSLTKTEKVRYAELRAGFHLMARLQAKARFFLKNQP